MTNPRWRIIGDQGEPDVFIPCGNARSIEILQDVARRMRGEWTPEERAERERLQAQAAAERLAQWERDKARHEELLKFSPHPTVTLILEAHGPRHREVDGREIGPECQACPGGFNDDGDIVHPIWPCATWKLIDQEEA